METQFVLFVFTEPSAGKVPSKLYYIDGEAFTSDIHQATLFNSREEAMKIQNDNAENFDLQIVVYKGE